MVRGFKLIGEITNVEIIAVGNSVRVLRRLERFYGKGRWRKLKGIAQVRFPDGTICTAEIHWYETSTIGRKEYKIKRIL